MVDPRIGSECLGCGAHYGIGIDFCSKCKTGQWIIDELLPPDHYL